MRIELRSKLIETAEYDPVKSRLKLYMANGQIREFEGVPTYVIDDLQATKSPGSYYMKVIRNRFQPSP